MRKILLGLISIAFSIAVLAQDSTNVIKEKTATGMRADGKIYVVMAVAVTILTGLFIYLIRLDRKITKLEKNSFPK
jgi:uncharacterized membrane protein